MSMLIVDILVITTIIRGLSIDYEWERFWKYYLSFSYSVSLSADKPQRIQSILSTLHVNDTIGSESQLYLMMQETPFKHKDIFHTDVFFKGKTNWKYTNLQHKLWNGLIL